VKAAAPLSVEKAARLRALADRALSREEVEAALAVQLTDAERQETLSLIAWFRRRYPTPAERLAYVRRAHRRWTGASRGGGAAVGR
jgi:hypothetical protein